MTCSEVDDWGGADWIHRYTGWMLLPLWRKTLDPTIVYIASFCAENTFYMKRWFKLSKSPSQKLYFLRATEKICLLVSYSQISPPLLLSFRSDAHVCRPRTLSCALCCDKNLCCRSFAFSEGKFWFVLKNLTINKESMRLGGWQSNYFIIIKSYNAMFLAPEICRRILSFLSHLFWQRCASNTDIFNFCYYCATIRVIVHWRERTDKNKAPLSRERVSVTADSSEEKHCHRVVNLGMQ